MDESEIQVTDEINFKRLPFLNQLIEINFLPLNLILYNRMVIEIESNETLEKVEDLPMEELNRIGYDIIGAAFEVRSHFDQWMVEGLYEGAMEIELKRMGYNVMRQVKIKVPYKGEYINHGYRADMIVNKAVIIEFKALSRLHGDEYRQLMTYIRTTGAKLGYLINFGASDFCVVKHGDIANREGGIFRIVNQI